MCHHALLADGFLLFFVVKFHAFWSAHVTFSFFNSLSVHTNAANKSGRKICDIYIGQYLELQVQNQINLSFLFIVALDARVTKECALILVDLLFVHS